MWNCAKTKPASCRYGKSTRIVACGVRGGARGVRRDSRFGLTAASVLATVGVLADADSTVMLSLVGLVSLLGGCAGVAEVTGTATQQDLDQLRTELTPGSSVLETFQDELLGVSRKYLIPILEYFDRSGITRREGNRRVLAGPPACP